MSKLKSSLLIPLNELKISFIASPGPGGQNVNKVATAVQLRFNVLQSSSLPADVKQRLIHFLGKKLTLNGDLIIKASRYRTQERNKQDAIERLHAFIARVLVPPKKRRKTKPPKSSDQRRLSSKKLQGAKKSLRSGKPFSD